jgi:leucyl/phenylalanyl-tRNA--protein transferase
MSDIALLAPDNVAFPAPERALSKPNGLLAVGGDLTPEWLLTAYAQGIFPWYDRDDGPILWWSPDPRAVLNPGGMHISRRLARRIRNCGFNITLDNSFSEVVSQCAAPRPSGPGTWITPRMQHAYTRLHRLGYAHSVEVWMGERLVGGLYGVSLGLMFFAESMFSRERDASKIALYHLSRQLERWAFSLIDCQVMNAHLRTLGVRDMPRQAFMELLRGNELQATRRGAWRLETSHAG